MGKRANFVFNIYSTLFLMPLELNNKYVKQSTTTRKIVDKIQSLTTHEKFYYITERRK